MVLRACIKLIVILKEKEQKMNDNNNKDIALQGFVNDIKTIINTARTFAVRSVDFCRVQMYLAFGKYVARNMQLTNVADTDKQKYYKLGTTNDG